MIYPGGPRALSPAMVLALAACALLALSGALASALGDAGKIYLDADGNLHLDPRQGRRVYVNGTDMTAVLEGMQVMCQAAGSPMSGGQVSQYISR